MGKGRGLRNKKEANALRRKRQRKVRSIRILRKRPTNIRKWKSRR